MIKDKRLDYNFMQHNISENYLEDVIKECNEKKIDSTLPVWNYEVELIDSPLKYHFKDNVDFQESINYRKEEIKREYNNIWKYTRNLSNLFEVGYLSSNVEDLNRKIFDYKDTFWFQWFYDLPYLEIQRLALYIAPSLEFIADCIKYVLGKENESLRKNQEITILLIQAYIDMADKIEINMKNANRMCKNEESKNTWDIEHWNKNELPERMNKIVKLLLGGKDDLLYPIVFSALSNIWIRNKNKNAKRIFREVLIDKIIKFRQEKLDYILNAKEWVNGKSAILHKLWIYSEGHDNKIFEENQEIHIREELWEYLIMCIEQERYIDYPMTIEKDETILLWLSAKLLSEEKQPIVKIKELLKERNVRFDGWNYNFEESANRLKQQCYLLSMGAMCAEWSIIKKQWKMSNEVYWYIWNYGYAYIRNTCYNENDAVLNYLLQLWSRLVYFVENPQLSKSINIDDVIVNGLKSIDLFSQRLDVLNVFILNLESRKVKLKCTKDTVDYIVQMIDRNLLLIKYDISRKYKINSNLKLKGNKIKNFFVDMDNSIQI